MAQGLAGRGARCGSASATSRSSMASRSRARTATRPSSPRTTTRYFSVNVKLGELDASHGFNVLDSWARNRVRHPDKTHVAVLVTETLGDRYDTALKALSEHLPLVVVELQAWRGKTEILVVPRVVLASDDLRLPKAAPQRTVDLAETRAPDARPTAARDRPSGRSPRRARPEGARRRDRRPLEAAQARRRPGRRQRRREVAPRGLAPTAARRHAEPRSAGSAGTPKRPTASISFQPGTSVSIVTRSRSVTRRSSGAAG